MLARTHSLVAVASLAGIAYYMQTEALGVTTIVLCLIFNTIGSLLPDTDQRSNKLWDLFPGGEMVARVFGVFMKHRGISHSILGAFLASKLIHWFTTNVLNTSFLETNLIYWSTMVGYVSHIVADSLTEEGVPLLFPIRINFGLPPIRSWRIKTGGWFENWIFVPLTILTTVLFVSLYWRK